MSEFDKPSRAEDEYFARQEVERRKQWAKEQSQKMAAAEKTKLKELHYMHCPKCGMEMKTIELHGIKVDQCPSCGGIYFDAGELEQLLSAEKSGGVIGRVLSVFK
jgi:rubrerythrin